MSALNKYEIAARLAAYGIDDEEIRGFLEAVLLDDIDTDDAPRTIFAEFVDAKRATASTYEAQARRARVACNSFEAVLAEIEAAEKPDAASDDTPEEAKGGNLRARNPERLRDAAYSICEGIVWSGTREGHAYWKIVFDRLREIAATAETAK